MSQQSRQNVSTASPTSRRSAFASGATQHYRRYRQRTSVAEWRDSREGQCDRSGAKVSGIIPAIEGLGRKLLDVTRMRILSARIEDWEQVVAVQGEFFGSIRPANTIMQIVRFTDPEWLVEIEADAVVES
jgi:hypothetical protein